MDKTSIEAVINYCKCNSRFPCYMCKAWDYNDYARCYFNTFLPMDWDINEVNDIIGKRIEDDEPDPIGHKEVR